MDLIYTIESSQRKDENTSFKLKIIDSNEKNKLANPSNQRTARDI